MSTPRRVRAVLKYDKKNIPLLIALAQAIYTMMTMNQALFFPTPNPSLATLDGQTKDLGKAQQAVKTRVVGAASLRDTKRDLLVLTLEALLVYVQGLADASADPSVAVSIIEAAGMKVATSPTQHKPVLAAKLGVQSGTVVARANASLLSTKGGRCFNWQYTSDGGKTWTSVSSTPVAHTTITGLPPLTPCGFRVCVTDAAGQGLWSQVVTIVVH